MNTKLRIFDIKKIINHPYIPELKNILLWGLIGFLSSKGTIIGGVSPFSIALVWAIDFEFLPIVTIGSVLGLFTFTLTEKLIYSIGIIIIFMLRLIDKKLKVFNEEKIFSLILALVSVSLLKLTFFSMDNVGIYCAKLIAEGIITFSLGVILHNFFIARKNINFLNLKKELSTKIKITLLIVLMSIVIVCESLFTSLGIIISGILIIYFTLTDINSNTIFIACSLGIALLLQSGNSAIFISVIFGALGCTIFSNFSKSKICIMYVLCSFLGSAFSGDLKDSLIFIISSIVGSIIMLILPQEILLRFSNNKNYGSTNELQRSYSSKMRNMSRALLDVGDTLSKVCGKIPMGSKSLYTFTEDETTKICSKCSNREKCWVNGYYNTKDSFNKMDIILKNIGSISSEKLPVYLKENCIHKIEICEAVNRGYTIFISKKTLELQNSLMRETILQQYTNLAQLLCEASKEAKNTLYKDEKKSFDIAMLFEELQLPVIEVSAFRDEIGVSNIKIRLNKCEITNQLLTELCREISSIVSTNVSNCKRINSNQETTLIFSRRNNYRVVFGVCTLPAKGDVCADVIKTFIDETNRGCMVLCDGMGIGKSAAIDGNIAATLMEKLLKAGLQSSACAGIVNSALAIKSGESGATIDTVTVDLTNGKAQFFKAGASSGFLVRKGKVSVYSEDSLPIGVLRKVRSCGVNLNMFDGDTVILVSDGVLSLSQSYIENMILEMSDENPAQIAHRIANEAKSKSLRADDISVAVMKLEKQKY